MSRKLDPILAIALLLALVFGLYGIRWGRVECWNRDQMALRGLHGLKPGSYGKPPFHTYLNHALILRPVKHAELITKFFTGRKPNLNEAKLLGSRLLTLALFLGTIVLAYLISLRGFGQFAARVIALLFATSAGFVAYAHFLSCDSPLLFWMMLTLFFAQRITIDRRISNYVWAGLLTGICTATKYNGLAASIVIPVAHFLSRTESSWKEIIFNRRLALGLVAVPVGFLLGNPFALFDWKKFSADFIYNYYVTPRYEGQSGGHGYLEFLLRVLETIGPPVAILIAIAIPISILVLVRGKGPDPAAVCFALAASIFLLYYAKFGAFPRMPTRFALPAIPFLILMAGPFFAGLASVRMPFYTILVPILLYNCACSFLVGKRFTEDPRSIAQVWIQQHATAGTVIESSGGSPHWKELPGTKIVELDASKPNWSKVSQTDAIDLRMPHANGRVELFGKIFASDPWIAEMAKQREGNPELHLFTRESLAARNPAIVTIYSSDYEVPVAAVRDYYSDFFRGNVPYDLALDGKTNKPPRWVYPREIDFLPGRMSIFVKR